jgi:type IV secretion system protein VirB1
MPNDLLVQLLLVCAPYVHPDTGARLVQVESAGNPYAIGVNGPYRLERQPTRQAEAIATARHLIGAGHNIDMGLAMINVKNLSRLGLTLEQVFDPCLNLKAMQTLLGEAYARASQRRGAGRQALVEALSEYNTGTSHLGQQNGYVSKVFNARTFVIPPQAVARFEALRQQTPAP